MIKGFLAALVALAFLAIIGVTGAMDYDDQAEQDSFCAEMVESGAWPKQACE